MRVRCRITASLWIRFFVDKTKMRRMGRRSLSEVGKVEEGRGSHRFSSPSFRSVEAEGEVEGRYKGDLRCRL